MPVAIPDGCTACPVLPIQLTKFEATPHEQQVLVEWQTAEEINTSHFEVERSRDGITFETMLRKNAQGQSNELIDYRITDDRPYIGSSYYRLKSIDLDGSFTYSEIRTVEMNGSNIVIHTLYPNPATAAQVLQVELSSPTSESTQLHIFNTSGQTVSHYSVEMLYGLNSIQVNTTSLASGVYYIRLTSSTSTTTHKFVIR